MFKEYELLLPGNEALIVPPVIVASEFPTTLSPLRALLAGNPLSAGKLLALHPLIIFPSIMRFPPFKYT
jgi:hypothetical protein